MKKTNTSFGERLQRNAIVVLLSLVSAILSIGSAIALFDPDTSKLLQRTAQWLSHPLSALTILILFLCLIVMLAWSMWQIIARRQPAFASDSPIQIQGRRLFEYEGLYPIDIAPKSNIPSLNSEIFVKAIEYFLTEGEDRLAAMDLVYLREDNRQHTVDVLPTSRCALYEQLLLKYDLHYFREHYSLETERLFRNAIRIVNDVGDTLAGTHCEFLLHDVRNPLRSIIAARNSEAVSGRRLFGCSTRFVVEYLRNQGRHLIEAMEGGGKVAYPKQFTTGKQFKATTIPLHDDQYGLIGLLCFNIDIDAVRMLTEEEQRQFFDNYVRTFGETPEFERDNAPSE